jgi:hypothetical protein
MCGLECSNLCVMDKLMKDLLSMNEILLECNYLRSIILFDLIICNEKIEIYMNLYPVFVPSVLCHSVLSVTLGTYC